MTLEEQHKAYLESKPELEFDFEQWKGWKYHMYCDDMDARGKFKLNYMNWLASEKYEAEKDRFKAHFVKLAEKEKEEKEKHDGQGREKTSA